jgi:hypothetical protein
MKNFLKKLLIVMVELAVISGALWYIAEKRGIHSLGQVAPALQSRIAQVATQPFPQLAQPIKKNFTWSYKGSQYELPLTLYQSVYAYYQSEPKTFSYTGDLPVNWEDSYYGMFLKANENDQTITELSDGLQILGEKHKLSSDQIVELALAFVQAIPYNDSKASNILAKAGNETMLYPYETLFTQQGVCSDKSLLAISILRKMGYGVAIFAYEQDNHMAIGIQCPQSYSTYGSGYCYGETTSVGNKIGIIPQFDAQSNKTADVTELANFNQEQQQANNLKDLGAVTIYQKTTGKEYTGIIETKKIEAEIIQLKTKMKTLMTGLTGQKTTVAKELADLKSQKDDLDNFKSDQNFEKYNANVEKYNALLEKYKQDVKNYNNAITLYNQSAQRYNLLIKQ